MRRRGAAVGRRRRRPGSGRAPAGDGSWGPVAATASFLRGKWVKGRREDRGGDVSRGRRRLHSGEGRGGSNPRTPPPGLHRTELAPWRWKPFFSKAGEPKLPCPVPGAGDAVRVSSRRQLPAPQKDGSIKTLITSLEVKDAAGLKPTRASKDVIMFS